jgi:hypothetical protein
MVKQQHTLELLVEPADDREKATHHAWKRVLYACIW